MKDGLEFLLTDGDSESPSQESPIAHSFLDDVTHPEDDMPSLDTNHTNEVFDVSV